MAFSKGPVGGAPLESKEILILIYGSLHLSVNSLELRWRAGGNCKEIVRF